MLYTIPINLCRNVCHIGDQSKHNPQVLFLWIYLRLILWIEFYFDGWSYCSLALSHRFHLCFDRIGSACIVITFLCLQLTYGTSTSGRHLGWRHFHSMCTGSCAICTESGNSVIQNACRKRKFPQRGSKNALHVLYDIICDPAILDGVIQDSGTGNDVCRMPRLLWRGLDVLQTSAPLPHAWLITTSERGYRRLSVPSNIWISGANEHDRLESFKAIRNSTLRESKTILWWNLSGDKLTSLMSFVSYVILKITQKHLHG